MGASCSTCQCAANKNEQITHQINHNPSASNNQTNFNPLEGAPTQEDQLSEQEINIRETNKNNKKRVQIIMPVSESNETTDNVRFKNMKIEASDIEEIKKTLQKHFILSQLDEKQILYLIGNMRYCTAKGDQYIFKQGDPSFSYYIILEGRCAVQINGSKKRELIFGDSFGDLGIVYNAPRSASILTLQNCLFAQLNRKTFRQITEDINSMFEKENRKFLQTVDFYKELNEAQKNAIAGDCLVQTYQEGQIIFNKGDDANSFYVIKEGIVTLKEKGVDLKQLESFGKNSIMHDANSIRNYTAFAKSKLKLLSMNKEVIRKNLGQHLPAIIRKKQAIKIIKQSPIFEKNIPEEWEKAFNQIEFKQIKEKNTIFEKGQLIKSNEIFVLIGTDVVNDAGGKQFLANTVIEQEESLNGYDVEIRKKCIAQNNGFLGKIKVQKKEALHRQNRKATVKEKNLTLNDLFVVRKLRSGNFGQVYATFCPATEKKYALKVMDQEEIEAAGIIKYIMNEEEALRETPPHPFLVKFYKLLKDSNFIYILMQLLEGEDMFDAMGGIVPMNSEDSSFYVMQILLVIQHLHKNRIIYRDLKPENIMLNEDGYIVLVDMGTAKKVSIDQRFKTSTIIGTPHYMAPEIITGKGYSFAVDLWSIGVILYQFLVGKLPFADLLQDPFAIYEEIMKSQIKFPRNIEQQSKSLLNRLLSRNPIHRLGNGYDEIRKHPYFRGMDYNEILEKKIDPPNFPKSDCKIKKMELEKALKKAGCIASNYFLGKKKK